MSARQDQGRTGPRPTDLQGDEEGLLALLGGLPRAEPPADLVARVLAGDPGGGSSARLARGLAIGALLLLALGGMVVHQVAQGAAGGIGRDAGEPPVVVEDPGVPLFPDVESFGVLAAPAPVEASRPEGDR